MDFDTGFGKATRILKEDVICKGLIQDCGYSPRNVLLFGFGQGGMAALATTVALDEELGGVISIGGPLPASVTITRKSKTPILVLGGSSNTLITKSAVGRLNTAFDHMKYNKWNKNGDGMPGNRLEMLSIMKFFARRLKSRSGVPEGSVEIV